MSQVFHDRDEETLIILHSSEPDAALKQCSQNKASAAVRSWFWSKAFCGINTFLDCSLMWSASHAHSRPPVIVTLWLFTEWLSLRWHILDLFIVSVVFEKLTRGKADVLLCSSGGMRCFRVFSFVQFDGSSVYLPSGINPGVVVLLLMGFAVKMVHHGLLTVFHP